MENPEIIACSKIISVHSLSSRLPINTYSPHYGIINCVNVNHSNRVIASCGQDGRIALVAAQNPSTVMLEQYYNGEAQKAANVNCCMFSPHSNFIVAGSSDSTVKLWDMKNSSVVHLTLKSHIGSVSSLAWVRSKGSQGDILASSSQMGEIYLHQAKTGSVVDTYSSKNKQPINAIRISDPQTHSRLGACTSTGSVYVWDLNAPQKESSMICNFNVSKHSITSFSFSSFNPVLLVSAGMDEQLVFYDVLLKKPVKTVSAEEPLTAISFHSNGHALVAGGMHGGLFIYDLRKLEKPREKLTGHDTAIKSIDLFKDYDGSKKEISGSRSKILSSGTLANPPPVTSAVNPGVNHAVNPGIKISEPIKSPPLPQSNSTNRIPSTSHSNIQTNPSKALVPQEQEASKSIESKTSNVLPVKQLSSGVEAKKVESRVLNENKLSTTGQDVIRQAQRTNAMTNPQNQIRPRDDLRSVHLSPQKQKSGEWWQMEKRIKAEMYDSFERMHMEVIKQFQINQQETRRMLEEFNLRERHKDARIKDLQEEINRLKKSSY